MASQRLTVFLLQGVEEFDDALDADEGETVTRSEVVLDGVDGCFYSKASWVGEPRWLGYLEPILSGRPDNLRSASASGLLVLKVDDDVFAITFGYGRSLLDQNKIVRRFGLKVVLNLIDPLGIKSLDTKVFEEMVVSRKTQASRSSDLPTFGVDVLRDILRAASGKAPEGSGYKTLSGSDALVLSSSSAVTSLPGTLRSLRTHYESTTYRGVFGWVDHLDEVRDPRVRALLDERLVEDLRELRLGDTHMALPESLDAEDVEHFTIEGVRGREYEELDLTQYLADAGVEGITLDALKRRKVSVQFVGGARPSSRSSVYQCLVSEQRDEESLFVLIEGRWYEVADTLVRQVDGYLEKLPASSLVMVPAKPGESEGAYNIRAAECNDALLRLDTQLVAPEGASSRIEFCDLLGVDGTLLHVKRKVRSSTLSHLFAQGRVSAETLGDEVAREQVREAIRHATDDASAPAWLAVVPGGDGYVDRGKFTIAYGVIANSDKAGYEWLPFFSRLNLMQAAQQLSRAGFTRVELLRIPLES